MTHAQGFEAATKGKYPDPSFYESTVGPRIFASRAVVKAAVVKYEITFIDGSKVQVIMTDAQYNGLRRSSFWPTIKTIGGLGYQKLISKA